MTVPSILFACVHNSGRSVAGEVLARHLGGDGVVVASAGSEPGDGVNPAVAAVLAERGLAVDDHRPSLLTREQVELADVVVTMGCGEACPYVPGKRVVDWPLGDPKGQPVEVVRGIVDELETRVRALLTELGVPVRD